MAYVHFCLTILVLSWISIAYARVLVSSIGRGDSGRCRRCLLFGWGVWISDGVTRMVTDLFYSDDTWPATLLLADRCFLWK